MDLTKSEPVLLGALFVAVANVIIAAIPDMRESLQFSLQNLALAGAAWWARRNSTPNIKVAKTKDEPKGA